MDEFAEENLPWIDRPDADIDTYVDVLPSADLGYDLKDALRHWREKGYLILKKSLDLALIDAYRADLQNLERNHRSHGVLVNCESRGVVPIRELSHEELLQPAYRVLDFHNASTAGKRLALARPVVGFLRAVFDQPVVAMQSLTFLRGSQQGTHQDFAYVVAERPSDLAANWIALEDVHPDAGPVGYYPGSHRIPKFDFGDGPFLTGQSTYDEHDFEAHIHRQCKERGLEFAELLIEKGDILIWHGSLAHRGTIVKNPDLTRLSLVVHYSSEGGYTRDRRAPNVTPVRYFENGACCFGDPIRPELENTFTAAGPWPEAAH